MPFSSGSHLVKQLPERQICLRVLKKLRQQQRSHNNKLGGCPRCVNPAWSAAVLAPQCQSLQSKQQDSVCIPCNHGKCGPGCLRVVPWQLQSCC